MRVLFMGTPDIAACSLNAVLQAGHEVCGVFTQADKPVGRGHKVAYSAVKETALANGLTVFQPDSLKTEEALHIVQALCPDLIVVVAYGKILPKAILETPRYGCINLHVSLLPKYRGAAPIQWAVLNGDKMTGVSIMQMDEGLDTGDVLVTTPVEIGENETSGELFDRVAVIGARTLCECIVSIADGTAKAAPQGNEGGSYAKPLSKEMAEIRFSWPAQKVHNVVRGMNPAPMAWFIFNGRRIKVTQTRIADNRSGTCGTVCSLNPLTVCCGDGAVELCRVIPEGKKEMAGRDWANGARLNVGCILAAE